MKDFCVKITSEEEMDEFNRLWGENFVHVDSLDNYAGIENNDTYWHHVPLGETKPHLSVGKIYRTGRTITHIEKDFIHFSELGQTYQCPPETFYNLIKYNESVQTETIKVRETNGEGKIGRFNPRQSIASGSRHTGNPKSYQRIPKTTRTVEIIGKVRHHSNNREYGADSLIKSWHRDLDELEKRAVPVKDFVFDIQGLSDYYKYNR